MHVLNTYKIENYKTGKSSMAWERNKKQHQKPDRINAKKSNTYVKYLYQKMEIITMTFILYS